MSARMLLAGALVIVQACTSTPALEDSTGASREQQQVAIDWSAVEAALGRSGSMQAGEVYRFGLPRTDLRVTAAGVQLRPAFALGSWIAMKAHGSGAVAMGDLVLLEDEVGPVIARLQEGGVQQTAVHHHVLRETPRIIYVHVHAHGDPVGIAETVRAAVALTGTPDAASTGTAPTQTVALDTAAINRELGRSGRVNGGVYQIGVPRAEAIRDGEFAIPPSMGLGTAINFQPTGQGRAAITGDFVMVASEVNPVIRALREHGIEVTSLHNHLLTEEPRLFFMHFWAHDDAVRLARGLRTALDRTNSAR